MGWYLRSSNHHCRWCGVLYFATKPTDRDGFCSPAHKMAHARAYKKYVTRIAGQKPGLQDLRVTQKKAKKRKCDTCSANADGCALWENPRVQGCKRYLKKSRKRGEKRGKTKKAKSR